MFLLIFFKYDYSLLYFLTLLDISMTTIFIFIQDPIFTGLRMSKVENEFRRRVEEYTSDSEDVR